MTGAVEPRDEVDWEQWFSDQYDLNERIDRAIAGMTEGKPPQARAALYASVCEHAAEQVRVNLP